MSRQKKTESHQGGVHQNGGFGSSIGFVLACVGSAVGMGNIWMFPYRLGQYGGGAFLVPYILFIVLFGLVGLSAEFAIGRRAGTGTLGAYEYCWNKIGKGKLGYILAWIHRVRRYRGMGGPFPGRFPYRSDHNHRRSSVFFPGNREFWQYPVACAGDRHSGRDFDVRGDKGD